MVTGTAILGMTVAAVGGIGVGYAVRSVIGRYGSGSAEKKAEEILLEARRGADALRREGEIQAKAEALKAKEQFENSVAGRRKELAAIEERAAKRENNLDRKVTLIEKRERALDERNAELDRTRAELDKKNTRLKKMIEDELDRLQEVAGMNREEARRRLLLRTEKEIQNEIGGLIRSLQDQARETAEREARKIVALAIQRCATSHAGEMMTSSVPLPGEDMKGRIIGREGRNIRALEAATGITVLIDDTPETVVLSGFDSVRREIARRSLETLIADGRIHPARIEEVVAKAGQDMEEVIRSAGEEAIYKTCVQEVDPELIKTLGRLKFRTSYNQNVLQHSIEVAYLMGSMAGELGLDPVLARRIGLFHDIGKALDHSAEGGHATIGADFVRKHGEKQMVVNAVAAHHEEVPAESVYAVLATAADAISSSRLGARSETTEIYIKRLEELERIAGSFDGVQKSYAIQAGRELRVIVDPEKMDDNDAVILARDITKKVQENLKYPGQIKVVVVRETRCVEYAK